MPEFYTILPKNTRILHKNCPKKNFPDFFGPLVSYTPMLLNYHRVYLSNDIELSTIPVHLKRSHTTLT